MKYLRFSLIVAVVVLGLGVLLSGVSTAPEKSNSAEKNPELAKENPGASSAPKVTDQRITGLTLPGSLSFAGEPAPLDRWYVREALDRELMVNTYWHSKTLHMMKLANRYFPEIESILAEQGVPADLKYIAVAESGLLEAESPAGAKGYWQFLKSAAVEFGLEVEGQVDERYDIKKSTVAACKYLKKAHDKFGNWTAAAASYNCGRAALAKQIDRQKSDSYYDLNLTTETGRYIYRILAIKELFENPEKYGFHLDHSDLYHGIDYSLVTVKSIPSIGDFAIRHNTTYKEIKTLNPWLRSYHMQARKSGKEYSVRVPN